MRSVNFKLMLVLVMGLAVLSACKKNKGGDNPTPSPTVDKIKDSALLVARELYLWYNKIPSSFDAQSYADPNKIMTAIRAYSIEPGFGNTPVDKWSFAVKKKEWDDVSSGSAQDFGLSVFFRVEGDLRVKYVEKASPAGIAGIKRGWRITKINGNTNMTTANADFIVNAVWNSSAGSFTFQKPDGSSVDINLNAAAYQENPVFLDSVYTIGARKAGYLVFNSFLGDTTAIYNKFQQVFNKFFTQGVTDVIIDLRYNGGGYVSMQEKLANYLVKSTATGQLMLTQAFNDKYAQYFNESTNFSKLGSLNPDNIYFIVSNNTASASELLINSLKPYMSTKLVGPSKTYGKPVGYFPYPVGDWYVFPISFRTTNKNNEGNYFGGMALDNQVADGLDKDWGDINESSLASVLKHIGTGAFRIASADVYQPNPVVEKGNEVLSAPEFKGTVDSRRLRKQ